MQLRRGFQLKVLTDGKIALPETYQGGLGGTIIELLKPISSEKEKRDNHFYMICSLLWFGWDRCIFSEILVKSVFFGSDNGC